MFTGLVAAVGEIVESRPLADGPQAGIRARIRVAARDASAQAAHGGFAGNLVGDGDSIAVQGVCLTVVERHDDGFSVDISRETLSLTVRLDTPAPVNLEKALRLQDHIGGHLVSGHVDGIGRVLALERVDESHRFDILVPASLAGLVARKGSLTVDGVSLTVNSVQDRDDGCVASINLIPHTIAVTTLQHRRAGDAVNLEVDLIARQVERLLQWQSRGR